MSKVITISGENVHYRKDYRMLKCPKCEKWNRISYQSLIDKIFIVTCKQCKTKYRPV